MAHISAVIPPYPCSPRRPMITRDAERDATSVAEGLATEWLASVRKCSRAFRVQSFMAAMLFEMRPCPLTRVVQSFFRMRVVYDWRLERGGFYNFGTTTAARRALAQTADFSVPMHTYVWMMTRMVLEARSAADHCRRQRMHRRNRIRPTNLRTAYVRDALDRLDSLDPFNSRRTTRISPFRQRLCRNGRPKQVPYHPLRRRLLKHHGEPV